MPIQIDIPLTLNADKVKTLVFEHSLYTMSKWESKYERPFFNESAMEQEEMLDYFSMMLVENEKQTTSNDSKEYWIKRLTAEDVKAISEYISSQQTATWFDEVDEGKKSSERITSEIIYYWMVEHKISWEAQHWHLNRLLTLVKVCGIKRSKPKKMSRAEVARRQKELNAKRKKELNTNG